MSAIQFEAVVKDNTIRIPEQFRTTLRKGKVQVTIRDRDTAGSRNANVWQNFLQGIKACDDNEAIEFERVDFEDEVTI